MAKIIIDSTTDLPDEIIEKYDIEILPLRILINSKDYLDKKTITVEEVYDEMKKGILPKTSQANPVDVLKLFNGYASKGIDFIFYSFSSKLSSTYETSFLAVEKLKEEYPHVNMKVIDTRAGSFGAGLIALQAAKLFEHGKSFDDVIRISYENIENIEHIFFVDDLNWLVKGGRVSKTKGVVGSALKVKPILNMEDGELCVIKNIRGRKRALMTLVDIVEDRIIKFPDQIIGIAHADDLEIALEIKEMIIERLGKGNILIAKIGSVLASHLGLGGVGILFLNKEPELYIK